MDWIPSVSYTHLEDVRTAARSILIFKELNIFLSVHALLELAVYAVFSVRNTAAFLKHGGNIFFGNSKSLSLIHISKQLYQKANIAIEGFEKTNLPDDHFDVVLGNVPFEIGRASCRERV